MVPGVLRIVLEVAGWCRLIGFCTMVFFFYNYERYHKVCVSLRQEEMRHAGLLEAMVDHDGFSTKVFQSAGLLEAILFPINGLIFGGIPAMQAVLSHIFTERLVYVVSLKPTKLTGTRPWKDVSRLTP